MWFIDVEKPHDASHSRPNSKLQVSVERSAVRGAARCISHLHSEFSFDTINGSARQWWMDQPAILASVCGTTNYFNIIIFWVFFFLQTFFIVDDEDLPVLAFYLILFSTLRAAHGLSAHVQHPIETEYAKKRNINTGWESSCGVSPTPNTSWETLTNFEDSTYSMSAENANEWMRIEIGGVSICDTVNSYTNCAQIAPLAWIKPDQTMTYSKMLPKRRGKISGAHPHIEGMKSAKRCHNSNPFTRDSTIVDPISTSFDAIFLSITRLFAIPPSFCTQYTIITWTFNAKASHLLYSVLLYCAMMLATAAGAACTIYAVREYVIPMSCKLLLLYGENTADVNNENNGKRSMRQTNERTNYSPVGGHQVSHRRTGRFAHHTICTNSSVGGSA